MDNSQSQRTMPPTFGGFSTATKDAGNPFGSGAKVFGTSVSSSPLGTTVAQGQNVFSLGSNTIFGAASKPEFPAAGTGSENVFSSGTGIAQSRLSHPSPSNLFSTAATSTTPGNVFGSVSAASSSSTPVFGTVGGNLFSSASTANTTLATAGNVFSGVSSASSPSTAKVFGTGTENAFKPLSSTSISGPTLFGKTATNLSTAPSSFASSTEPVFGSFGKKGETTSTSAKGFGLFQGGVNQTPVSGSATVFGSKQKTEGTSATSSSSPFSTGSNQPGTLFGKPQSSASNSSTSSSLQSSSSFQVGKEKTSSAMLFGKPVAGPQSAQSTQIQIDSSSSAAPQSSSSVFSSSFDSQPKSTSSYDTGKKGTVLFGKPAPLFSGARPIVTAEVTSIDDVEDNNDQEETSSPKKQIARWKSSRKSATAMPLNRRRSLVASSKSTSESDVLSGDTAPSNVLKVRDIPPDFCEKETLRNHFSQYGNIKLMRVIPESCSAHIAFDTKDSALKAKDATSINDESPPMSIFYGQVQQTTATKRLISKHLKEPRKKVISQDAQDELKSMAEIPEFETGPVSSSKAHSSPKPQRPSVTRRHSPTPPPPRRSSPTPPLHSAITVPQDAADAHAPPDIGTLKALLKSIHQAKAFDTNERIAILDKRDQLLKLLRGRQQSDLASASAFKGTCPDMCPEKERYYREDTRRLALYEVILSTMSTVTGLKTKVDHSKAVKEYSRSSADQVEPLPHELRPLPVLQSTMVYLLTYVADEGGEGKWSEWYDFFWNRTRGIRKDITQQQLCHVNVAHLLEQCARFHIFCSERLCEEDMMTFDDKINNENLTKCLQTLKELYSDLDSKHNCYCPNEAEIRAYIVLMNLNQGDTLREIQQFRQEIRDSPCIRFAVRAYNALNSNNYVRFFRLIKETTFLNGCILHRYFNQIRSKALLIMKRAMTTGKPVFYPVTEMIRLMCFENASEVVEFCSHYGLKVESSAVVLDSTSLYEPEGSLPQRRSITLIESKRAVSVGETIFGGPLPAMDLPQPFSSFDEDGRFVFSNEFHQALMAGGLKHPSQGLTPVFTATASTTVSNSGVGSNATSPAAGFGAMSDTASVLVDNQSQRLPLIQDVTRLSYSNDAIKSAARSLILEETDGQAVSIVHEVIQEEITRKAYMEVVFTEVFESAVQENIRSVAADVVEEEEQELRHALEEASRKQQCTQSLSNELMDEVIDSFVKDVTKEEWKRVEGERHRLSLDRCAQACTDIMLDLVVREQIDDVASEVFQVDVVAKRERLAATEARVLSQKMRHCFQRWHRLYLRSVRVRRSMLDFPVAPPSHSHSARLSALVPSRPSPHITGNSFYVGERAKLTVTSPMDTVYNNLHLSANLSMASAQQMLSGIRMWQPLDIVSTSSRQLFNLLQEWKDCNIVDKDTGYIQWKMVLSTPAQKSHEAMDFTRWMRTKLGWEMSEDGSDYKPVTTTEGVVISKFTTSLIIPQAKAMSLSFCVRSFHGNWKDNQATNAAKLDVLKGMSGLVFVTLDAGTLLSAEEAHWKKDRLRLHDLLTMKPKYPAVPLVVIIPRLTADLSVSSDILDDRLQLTKLHQKGLLSAVHFAQPCIALEKYEEDFGTEWTTQLSNCIRFLASRIPSPPSLAIKPLADYVEDGVVEHYKSTVYQDLRTRTRHQLLHQSPNTLLTLYNDIIDHLAMVVASDTLTKSSWPAPEFDQQSLGLKSLWNSEDHLCGVYELMTKLRLPFFRYSDMEVDSWEVACQDVWKYIETVTKKDSGSAKICLYQKVVDILHLSQKRFDQFCWLASEDGNCNPSYVNMAWTDLIDACIHYKMVSLRTGHLHLSKDERDKKEEDERPEEEEFEEIIVYYDQSELEDYETPSSWLAALRDTETVASLHIKETIMKKSGVKRTREENDHPQTETLKKRNRFEDSCDEVETSLHSTKTAEMEKSMWSTETDDPALKSLSESYFEMLDSEKEASERYEKILASVLDNNLNQSVKFTTPYYPKHEQDRRQKELTPNSTPNRKHTTTINVRPDLKRRKLSEMLSGSVENFPSKLDDSMEGEYIDTELEKSKPNSNFDLKHDDTMTNKLMDLKEEVERQKQIDTLYEMKLKRWMADGDLN